MVVIEVFGWFWISVNSDEKTKEKMGITENSINLPSGFRISRAPVESCKSPILLNALKNNLIERTSLYCFKVLSDDDFQTHMTMSARKRWVRTECADCSKIWASSPPTGRSSFSLPNSRLESFSIRLWVDSLWWCKQLLRCTTDSSECRNDLPLQMSRVNLRQHLSANFPRKSGWMGWLLWGLWRFSIHFIEELHLQSGFNRCITQQAKRLGWKTGFWSGCLQRGWTFWYSRVIWE